MIASGWYTGWLISGVFQHNGEVLPDTFAVFPSFQAHAVLATLLATLIALHIAAALYHQFVLKDGSFPPHVVRQANDRSRRKIESGRRPRSRA